MPQQARPGRLRYLPDAEEAQDMVDAVGIEIARHHLQAALPPGVAVLGHCLPVVGWEAPVLSFCGEVIGWGADLHIKVEQIGM